MKIKLTSELAKICGELTGDGHIQLQDWRGLVSFYSKEYSVIEDFEERFRNIFCVKGRIYIDKRQTTRYKLFFISKPVAEYLAKLEVPVGNKTNSSFLVPKWIFDGSAEFKAAYLRGLFNAEGSVNVTKTPYGPRWRIELEMYKWTKYRKEGKVFIEQLVCMLEELGIRCSPVRFGRKNLRKNGTCSIAIKLNIEKSSFGNFYKQVGFDDSLKAEKLSLLAEATLSRCGGFLQ